MSRQPHIDPPDTPPLSSEIAGFLSDCQDNTWMLIDSNTLQKWIHQASAWEKLAAEFQVARDQDQKEINYWVRHCSWDDN